MPHAAVRLTDGVTVNRTPTLNGFALSASQLIRYQYDEQGNILAQKYGGWVRYFPNVMPAPVRALWAWQDTQAVAHLAYGTQTISTSARLGVITTGNDVNITPTATTDNVTPAAATVNGSSTVTITDATTPGITSYDAVYIETHMTVGGLVLFGMYPTVQAVGVNTYTITATDIFGNPVPATATTSTTAVALFTTVITSNVVQVTLANHGYLVGATYPVLVSTTVGGVTLYGNYIVESVIDANNFTIFAAQNATSSTTGSINGGNARLLYSFGIGAVPPGSGFGIGGFGRGGFGTGTGIIPATGTPIAATDWTLDNWGEVLLACPINATLFQPIYVWGPLWGSPIASVIPQAPPLNDGMFVAMPQRQIIAWGSTVTGIQDPLLIRWCDVNNYTVWVAQVTNQAGSYRLPRGSRIVGAIQGPQQCLIWTDIDVWAMQYTGPPYIYSFLELGSGCGLIARKAAAAVNGIVYWMAPSQFFALSGSGVTPISCPVWDVIFQDLDQSNLTKIRVAVNSRFNEIAWFYPTMSSGGEVSAYVKYNTSIGEWDYGTLARSAWIDQSVIGAPVGADPTSEYIYQHEQGNDADGVAMVSSMTTGYLALAEGDEKIFVDQVWPDMRYGDYGATQGATVNITFNVADYPSDTPQTFGPFAMTSTTGYLTPRFRARLMSMTIGSSDIGSFWRIGLIRYRYSPDGRF